MKSVTRWWALAVLMLFALGACAVDAAAGAGGAASSFHERPARHLLAQAEVLAAAVPELHARLAATERGLAWREGEVRGPGTAASHLHVSLPELAGGEVVLASGAGEAHGTCWRLQGARASAVALDAGRAVYRDALDHTDVVWTAEERRAELFLLLRDEAAPATFRWRVTLGAGLVKGEPEATGGVAFLDAAGRRRLRVGPAYAVDAAGTRREASLGWSDGALRLTVDTRGLEFPVLVDPPVETVAWDLVQSATPPPPRMYTAAAYDSARGRTVLFGGQNFGTTYADTWEWSGATWAQRTPATSPVARIAHALAYDSARGRTVLFGGLAVSGNTADTWEWDGTSWAQQTPSAIPPPREGHAMAYDSARGKVVLFGGLGANAYLADTWEWDGTTWTQRTPLTSPPARQMHALAYDSARGMTVLFGGTDKPSGSMSDTWEWDGTSWTQRTPATQPPPRITSAMAYDSARGRTVLFGGWDPVLTALYADTWEWDGTSWTKQTPVQSPSAREVQALVYDSARAEIVLFGGQASSGNLSDTWEWDGTSWTQRTSATPPARSQHAEAFDGARTRTVLFGGIDASGAALSDTWEWDGTTWAQPTPATSPAARSQHAEAYDSAHGRTVLFGGRNASGSGVLSDTWTWDGASWTQRTPATSPPPRQGHALAYDTARAQTVLFGGYDASGTGYLSDTWEWDDTTWVKRTPATSPPRRLGHALAYDGVRARTVLFGGFTGGAYLSDTWEWDGTTWVQQTPATSPPGREGHAMVSDGGKVVVFGGYDGSAYLSDTWEWDGTTWVQQTPATSPPASAGHAMAYDAARGEVMLFGGSSGSGSAGVHADTWVYRTHGGGCTADAQCEGGSCVDGVCCTTACGGGDPGDCMVCSAALGATADGVCTTLADGAACAAGTCQAGACTGTSSSSSSSSSSTSSSTSSGTSSSSSSTSSGGGSGTGSSSSGGGASGIPAPGHGCGCHVAGAGQGEAAWVGALGVLGLLARRRRAARP